MFLLLNHPFRPVLIFRLSKFNCFRRLFGKIFSESYRRFFRVYKRAQFVLFSVVFIPSPPFHHGSVWVLPFISLLLTITVSPVPKKPSVVIFIFSLLSICPTQLHIKTHATSYIIFQELPKDGKQHWNPSCCDPSLTCPSIIITAWQFLLSSSLHSIALCLKGLCHVVNLLFFLLNVYSIGPTVDRCRYLHSLFASPSTSHFRHGKGQTYGKNIILLAISAKKFATPKFLNPIESLLYSRLCWRSA
jgi:hypothetical protein